LHTHFLRGKFHCSNNILVLIGSFLARDSALRVENLRTKYKHKKNTKMRYFDCCWDVCREQIDRKENSSNRTLTHITCLLPCCPSSFIFIPTNTGSCKQIINKPPAKNHVSTGEVVRGKNPRIVFALRCARWLFSSFSTISHSTLKFCYEMYHFVLYLYLYCISLIYRIY
jgi:hypothetical protein